MVEHYFLNNENFNSYKIYLQIFFITFLSSCCFYFDQKLIIIPIICFFQILLSNKNIQLNENGNVEILDKNGIARYNNTGELLTTDELVQEFLTQNPHFVTASPSGSGSVSNVVRGELNTRFNIEDLDMSNPRDREKYAKWKQDNNSKPRVINS